MIRQPIAVTYVSTDKTQLNQEALNAGSISLNIIELRLAIDIPCRSGRP